MSHTIHGYVAKHEDLIRVFGRAARLPQGLGFTPDSIYNDQDGFYDISTKQEASAIAKIQQLAWVRTDFFGGGGTQSAKLWQNGKLVYEEDDSQTTVINAVLKRLGIKCTWPGGKPSRQYIDDDGNPVESLPDEFDAVNFGHCRENESFAVEEIPSEERMKRQAEWKKEQTIRPPEEARTGDYIKLLVQVTTPFSSNSHGESYLGRRLSPQSPSLYH